MDISFEFFPPKTENMEISLWNTLEVLRSLKPKFVSVTYGAGGTTRERTHLCVKRLIEETNLNVAAHLTCVSASKSEVHNVIEDYKNCGVKSIVALRGDMPDMGEFTPHPQGYKSSIELVEYLKETDDFEIFVSAYPEKHPQSVSEENDINFLKTKIQAGATCAMTQFAFDIDIFLRFRDRLSKAKIETPMMLGIMPTTNFESVCNMAKKCGATIPKDLLSLYEAVEDIETRKKIAIEFAVEQCLSLKKEGFDAFHFYTLNQADFTKSVCNALGVL